MKKLVVCASVAWLAGTLICSAETPDFFVDCITSDAVYDKTLDKAVGGKIDTGYLYKGSDKKFPRTTKVSFDYYSYNSLRRPGETDGKMRAIFGVWDDNGALSCFRRSGDNTQFWTPGFKDNYTLFSGGQSGRNTLAIDYLTTNVWLNGTSKVSGFKLPSTGTAGYKLCYAEHCNLAYLDVYGFEAWEQADAESEPALAMNLRPCCFEGRAALYDTVSERMIFPDSDGYTLPLTNDVTVADGGKFYATPLTVGQKSVTFEGGATLYFDGTLTLGGSGNIAFANETATLTVNLTDTQFLQLDYVLMKGLPTGVRVLLGRVPAGYAGEAVLSEGTLTVKLSELASDHPEAIAETLRSDAQGYIPTGYFPRTTKSPTTSRVAYEWYDTACGKGVAPGPTKANDYLAVFGYWDDATGNRLGARYNNGVFQPISRGSGTSYYGQLGVYSGDQKLEIDLTTLTNAYTRGNGTVETWKAASYGGDDVNEIFAFGLSRTDSDGVFSKGAVYDFKSFKVWETSDGGETETLARDFVPCWNGGKAGMWDRITGAIRNPVADTNGFTVANLRWRLAVNDAFGYLAEGEPVRFFPQMGDSVGFKVVGERSGTLIAQGTDGSAAVEFEMLGEPVAMHRLYDLAVGAGETLTLGETTYYRTLSFGAGAHLALPRGVQAVVDGTLVLPTDGTVTVDLAGVTGVGVYTVLEGLDATASPDSFAVGALPVGYAGTFEKWDDKLVLRVDWDRTDGAAPVLVTSVQSDGIGWIDTDYFYNGKTFPKTSRVRMEAYAEKYGRNPAGKGYEMYSFFGTWDGVMTASRWSSDGLQIWHSLKKTPSGGGNNYSYAWVGSKANIVLEFDYLDENVWMTVNGGEPKTFNDAELAVSSGKSTRSMYLFGVNGNNTPGYYKFNEFRVWETPDGESETLAVDMVPCVSGGKAGAYDKIRNRVFLPTCKEGSVCEFTVPDWGMDFSQDFARVSVASAAPAMTAEFGPQNVLTLTKDATVKILKPVTRMTVVKYVAKVDASVNNPKETRYEAVGEPEVYTPAVGQTLDVKIGTAAKMVLTVEGGETAVQDFGVAKVTSAAEALCRSFEVRHSLAVRHEVMVAADATVSFAEDYGPAVVTRYAADGTVVSSAELTPAVRAGVAYEVTLGDGVAYAVVAAKLPRRGSMLIVR